MGKAYGHRSSKSNTFYTPYSITQSLFKLIPEEFDYNKTCFEPACGSGTIVKILKEYFNLEKVFSSDIVNGYDFLKLDNKIQYDYICTNPPFNLVNEFILKCKDIAKDKFCLFMKTDFLSGYLRYRLCYENQNLHMINYGKNKSVINVFDKNNNCLYQLKTNQGKLLKGNFDVIEGSDFNLKYIIECVRKPDLRSTIREDGCYSPAIEAYAWYVWDKSYNGLPMLKWINNQKYIIGKES